MLHALVASWALFGAAPGGCPGLDLPTALSLVAERSDEVAIKALERASAETDLALARAAQYVPSASATVVTGPVSGAHGTIVQAEGGTSNRSLEGLGPFVRIDANVVQPVWTWGQLDAAKEAATAGVAARSAAASDVLEQTQLRVAQLFWAHALAAKLLSVASSVDKVLAEVDKRVADAIAKNDTAVGPNDRYRVDLMKAELARRRADAEKARALAEIGIAATLAMDTAELRVADVPLPTSADAVPEVAKLVDAAESQRPDLAAVSHAIEARKAQVRAAQAAMLPQFFLAGTFSFAYAPNRDLQTNPWVIDPFRELYGGIVLGARQDFALHVQDAHAEKARAELAVLERQQEGLRRLVRAQVESARAEWVASRARLDASQGGAASAKSWFRAVELDFGVGVEDGRSLLDSYTGYVENQIAYATAQYEMVVARAQLDQAVGAPLARAQGACPAE